MRKIRLFLLTTLAVLCSTLTTWAAYDGNPQAPAQITADNYGIYGFTEDNWSAFSGYYAISNAAELYGFAELVNGGTTTANAVLTANIEVNENVLNANGSLNGNGSNFKVWTPIGTDAYKYAGTFDGNGHTISGLYFYDTSVSYVGLIGYANGATIKNVGVIDSYISGYTSVGGICGSCNTATATTITNCYNTGTVSGVGYVGGICGIDGTQTNCYNTGTVSGSGNYIGGICGVYGTQTNCYNTGMVSASSNNVGGICGDYGTQTNCYYLAGCCSKSGGGVSVTADDIANGRLTYLLNGSTSGDDNTWRQTFGNGGDALPVLDNTHGVVYVTHPCTSEFSNTTEGEGAIKEHPSTDDVTGYCSACGQFAAQGTLVTESNYSTLNLTADFVGYYAISNSGELYWFANEVNNGNNGSNTINAVLTADIVVNEKVLNDDGTLNSTPTYSWTPIGTSSYKYAGTFDGNGHTVSGLYVNGNNNDVGLMGYAYGATIKNVGVVDSYIRGYMYVGGICGQGGTQTNCYNTGTVSGATWYVGGICGYSGTQTNCHNTGTVSGDDYVGGICGDGGTQTNCYYLAGSCSASGGGVSVSTEEFASGKITYLLNGSTSEGNLAWRQTLGDGGDAFPTLDGSHGTIYATQPCTSGFSNDSNDAHKEHSPMDKTGHCTACGQLIVQGATLVTASNYRGLNLTADFVGYYAISNSAELYWFANEVNSGNTTIKNAVLTANIVVNENVLNADGTLNGTPTYIWTPIGMSSQKYAGIFDGNGHTISGLYFNNTTNRDYPNGGNNVGLIGYDYGATIKNVGVVDSYLKGCSYVGGICGYSYDSNTNITNCYNTGTISGFTYVGGICGWNGRQTYCYNTGTVSGSYDYVGGICGDYGTQTNCYNTGTVSGSNNHVGGICGDYGTQTYCCYLEGCGSKNTKGVSVKAEKFASGYVAYWLNGSFNGTRWRQTLFADASPIFDATHNAVTGYVVEENDIITVYGDLVVATNYEIPEGKTLLVPANATVTTTGTAVITNNGTLRANGTLSGNNLAGNGTFITNRLSLCSISNLDESYVYKSTAYTLEDGLSGVAVNTTILGKTFTLDATISSPSYTNNRNVGTATISWTNTADANDVLSREFEITPKEINLVWSNAQFTYNRTAQAPSATATGMVGNDACEVTVSGAQTNAGSYTATAESLSNTNYKLPEDKTKAFNISPKTIKVTATAESREYDSSIDAEGSLSTADIISGDNVTISYANAEFNNKNVGTGKVVTFSGITIGGTSSANYALSSTSVTANANITAKGLNPSNFAASDKTYDGTTNATGGAFSDDRVSGDALEFSFDYAFADKNAANAVAVNFSNIAISGGADKDNYSLLTTTGTCNAKISPVTDEVAITITLADKSVVYSGAEQTYNAADALTIEADNVLYNLDWVSESGNAASVSGTNAGEYAFGWNAEMFSNSSANFTNVRFDVTDGKLIITPNTEVVVTVTENSDELVYNTEEQSVSGYTVSISDATRVYSEDDIEFSGNAVAAGTTVGKYEMHLSAADFSNTNENFANVRFEIVDGALTINRAAEAPNKPEATMETRYINTQLVALPTDWAWSENKALEMGTNTATANYTGADKGNYETESVEVTITRLECLHNEGNDILYTLDPTCTHKGYTGNTSCKLCGEIYEMGDSIPALGHDFVNTVVAATCTTEGYTEHLCSRCQHIEYSDTVAAKGHKADSVEFENVVAATCTTAGSRDSVVCCSVCQIELSREEVVIPATGHEAGVAVAENPKAATCTEDGSVDSVVYCTVCKAELSRKTAVIKATGHLAGVAVAENLKEATCTEAGSVDSVVYCTVCKEELSRKTVVIEATGHDAGAAVAENLKAATCTEVGSVDSVVYCTVCKTELSRKTVELPVIPHTAGEAVAENLKEATCTEAGSVDSVVYCTVCKKELSRKTVVIEAKGHKADSIVIENVVAATYEAAGSYDSVVYCSVCKVELSRTTVEVPQLVAPKIDAEVVISQLDYTIGDSLKLDGGKLIITTSDSTTAEIVITPEMISGFNPDSVGVQTVTVAFEIDGVAYTTTFEVEVKEAEVIEVVAKSVALSAPVKITYKKGEQLDIAGGKLTVTFSDGTTKDVELKAEMVSGFDAEKVGTQKLTVTLTVDKVTLSATFDVTVEADDDTAISDDEAAAVNIYAYQNVIVVENATADINVYNAMGALVDRVAANADRTEIQIDMTGVYVVKTGNSAKRVMIND